MNTLPEQDALIVIAEVSIAVAGFAGIIAAIGRPRDPAARLAIKNVVLGAMGNVLFSLFPIVLSLGGLPNEWIWRAACAGAILAGFVYYVANWSDIAFSTAHRVERLFMLGDTIVLIALAAAVFGHPPLRYGFVYLGLLFWGLVSLFRYFAVSVSSLWAGDDS